MLRKNVDDPLPEPQTIGQRLRILRGKTARQTFAPSVGVHEHTLMRYERDERLPDAALLARLVERFGVNAEWLLLGTGSMYRGAPEPAPEPQRARINTDVLKDVITVVEKALARQEKRVDWEKRARLIVLLYDEAVHTGYRPNLRKAKRFAGLIQ